MAVEFTSALRDEYNGLFAKIAIRPERRSQVANIHARIIQPTARQRYDQVEQAIKVPWFVVAIIHNLEASLRFDCHLHNGDPLTGRTFHVPANRPPGNPPFEWQASAIDALTMKRLDTWTDWSLAGIAFVLERYNGFGYRNNHPNVKSPYLWSFSNIYTKGKFVADHVFSDDAVSQQCGGLTMLRHMMDVDAAIATRVDFKPSGGDDEESRPFPHSDGPEGSPPRPDATAPTQPPPRYPGRYLHRGIEDDEAVKQVQARLKELRADPGAADGDFGAVTEFAVMLFQARSSAYDGEPLEIDGVVGPKTWGALFGQESIAPGPGDPVPEEQDTPADNSLAATVIDIADREVGVREDPLGSNRGPRVDQYIRAAGLNPAASSFPWCMCFVFFCFREAAQQINTQNLVPKNASVHLAWQATKQNGLPISAGAGGTTPVRFVTAEEARRNPSMVRPGMVFFLDTGGGRGHAGIVAANINASLETIEGNTTAVEGSREGVGVFRRTKRKVFDTAMMGFASFG